VVVEEEVGLDILAEQVAGEQEGFEKDLLYYPLALLTI
jgi:hypothetical protein